MELTDLAEHNQQRNQGGWPPWGKKGGTSSEEHSAPLHPPPPLHQRGKDGEARMDEVANPPHHSPKALEAHPGTGTQAAHTAAHSPPASRQGTRTQVVKVKQSRRGREGGPRTVWGGRVLLGTRGTPDKVPTGHSEARSAQKTEEQKSPPLGGQHISTQCSAQRGPSAPPSARHARHGHHL